MRTASEVKMMINGKATASLDIIKEHNKFYVYEYDVNVFCGGYLKTKEFIEAWKEKRAPLVNYLKASGNKVEFVQNI